jgi:alpha-L-rhamnosidase
MGLDLTNPRFSWKLVGERRGILQSAYEINVMSGEATIWNSGKVTSDRSTFVRYDGPELMSDQSYRWQVRIWDNENHVTDWSATSTFHLGFLKVSDWKARWIMMDPIKPSVRSAQMFRKDFTTKKQIQSARLYISAHGIYEASINGMKVGIDHLTPGWTSYTKRIQYQVYDVTTLLSWGENVVAAEVGNGWYRSNLAWENQQDVYGKALGLLAQLMITYKDGSTDLVVTDQSWNSAYSAIEDTEIYHGETIDARKMMVGWNMPGIDDASWNNVTETPERLDNLVCTYN